MSGNLGPHGIEYAKKFSTEAIDLLIIPHLESIHKAIPDNNLSNLIIDLGVMSEQIKKTNSPIFTKSEIDSVINRILTIIVRWNPYLEKQLELFLNAHIEIGEISSKDSSLPPYAPLKYAEQNIERVKDAHNEFVQMVKNFNTKIIDEIQIRALLLAFSAKMETVGNSFEKQFKELLVDFGLQNKYDVSEIFSVNTKIQRNTIYETDTLAVRDAISHYRYKINKIGDLWEIVFNNTEKGWNFNQKYSYDEFLRFLDNNHKMFISQLIIVQTIGVNTYLKRYLMK